MTALLCRNATTFDKSGEFDEEAFRQLLRGFVKARIGVYLASSGSGEGNALTHDELRRIYRIGVEECKGKVPVYGNPPEHQSARLSLEQIMLAVEAGVEIVNVYGPPNWHSYRPTDDEYIAFFDEVLPSIKHPVALSPNPGVGYTPNAGLIADLCHKYRQVVAVNLVGQPDEYFIRLKDCLKRDVPIYVPLTGSLHTLLLGAAGVVGGEFHIILETCRSYVDFFDARRFDEAARVYADIKRFVEYMSKWRPANPRWIKMAMKVLKLPGGEGGVRGPYRMPPAEEMQKFTDGLLGLRIPEIERLAHAAGLSLPV
jgi:dihydrodipicolinate synthase/N-acetylneuraminate lyase